MVGLNHEFARELLWREYPTDQRGSVFRQFWDPAGFLGATDDPALRERLRDIPPIHTWARRSALGDHDNRDAGGPAREELVLVLRGDLLKRYPNAVIYAHRASWAHKADGSIDPSKERTLVPIADESAPPRDRVKTPLYEARVDPDIAFIGFDLTAAVALGGTGENPADDPGWFFVIKERPGEPRFGFDVSRDGPIEVWNDLAWPDVLPAGELVPVGAGAPAPDARDAVVDGRAGEGRPARRGRPRALGARHDVRRRGLRAVPGPRARRGARGRDADPEDGRRCRTSPTVEPSFAPRRRRPARHATGCSRHRRPSSVRAPPRRRCGDGSTLVTAWTHRRSRPPSPTTERRPMLASRPSERPPRSRRRPRARTMRSARSPIRARAPASSRTACPSCSSRSGSRRASVAAILRPSCGCAPSPTTASSTASSRALRRRDRCGRALLGRRLERRRRRRSAAGRVARARGRPRLGTGGLDQRQHAPLNPGGAGPRRVAASDVFLAIPLRAPDGQRAGGRDDLLVGGLACRRRRGRPCRGQGRARRGSRVAAGKRARRRHHAVQPRRAAGRAAHARRRDRLRRVPAAAAAPAGEGGVLDAAGHRGADARSARAARLRERHARARAARRAAATAARGRPGPLGGGRRPAA